jgi:2-polyprenyl-3-methyl-5-hydroxy-6-metoxy-1,4-benzoquinol methylase
MNLRQRHRQPEEMDRPDIAEPDFAGSLQALERINWLSGSAGILWPAIRDLARQLGGTSLSLLDLATGAGDIPLRLWGKARRASIALELHGCDRSGHAVHFATQRARDAQADVRFFQFDALNDPFPAEYDIVTTSLFLHHLDSDQAIELLRRMAGAARRLVLVNDLNRCRRGFLLAWIGARLLSRSPVAHVDAPRSVEGAFTPQEALELARRAGWEGARVARRWPCRFLLAWRKPPVPQPYAASSPAKSEEKP